MSVKQMQPKLDLGILTKLVGDSITSSLPPTGFNPLTAPQKDLAVLGFPRRPNPALQPAEYAVWEKMFDPPFYFEQLKFSILPLIMIQARELGRRLPRRQTSLNWSGAYITPRDGTIFSSIWGSFQVPTPKQPIGGTANKYRSSTWIGFDGQRRYYMSTLPQFGTAQNIDVVMGVPQPSFFAWWQWWLRTDTGQSVPVSLSAPAIHAGDLILCLMQVADDRAGVSFMMKNLTTSRVVQFSQGAPPSEYWHRPYKVSGATAEWVMERSAEWPDPTPLELPDYGTVDFHGCGATAVNVNTGRTVDRSLSAAKLIDMYAVRHKPERTEKISIAKPIDTMEFLTKFP
ncbi:G1 family glutamic endopeptidase [Bradyrhizobium sp. CCBAU 53415]|uniref:G1 family glutamic endopeptidase n=1 Tax=Bradyrhizobium sp. CCBAU 53415 TaxID=1325119 RepID=UPI0023056E68|nr:G1 family glutamic endopeptidase [Bradyrhizobium sp. CCBAU 53415]